MITPICTCPEVLFISNLPCTISKKSLKKELEKYYNTYVMELEIVLNQGTAFAQMRNPINLLGRQPNVIHYNWEGRKVPIIVRVSEKTHIIKKIPSNIINIRFVVLHPMYDTEPADDAEKDYFDMINEIKVNLYSNSYIYRMLGLSLQNLSGIKWSDYAVPVYPTYTTRNNDEFFKRRFYIQLFYRYETVRDAMEVIDKVDGMIFYWPNGQRIIMHPEILESTRFPPGHIWNLNPFRHKK